MKEKWLDVIVKLYEQPLRLNKISTGTKRDNADSYLEVLENARREVMESKNPELEELLKQFYYDLYVIKEEDIPYSVVEDEVRIAREMGYGDIPITDTYKKKKKEEVITNQKSSLDKWIEFFLYDEEAKEYEAWEVYWVLEGLQKLGHYDKTAKKYTKRNKNTIYPFPELNKAAIFNTVNLMEEYLKTKTSPQELKAALGQGNFKILYEYSLEQLKLSKKTYGIEGKWIKYDQGSDYNKLRDSLQGYNTNWCTAAGEKYAKNQLKSGDFYVYYSIDENGEYRIPRIAIRMIGHNKIAEIRGIAKDQHMEPEMLPILNEKLKDFPEFEVKGYYKRISDMKSLTEIDTKVKNGEELTLEELKFLYEIDNEIEGFGWRKDPRIEEIISKRDDIKDLSKIYNIKAEQITDDFTKITTETVIFKGNLRFKNPVNIKSLIIPQNIRGTLFLNVTGSLEDSFNTSQKINGDLSLNGLEKTNGFKLPNVAGDLYIIDLKTAKNLDLSHFSGKSIYLDSLIEPDGLVLPSTIKENLNLKSITTPENLVLPSQVGGYLILRGLRSAEGLVLPQNVGGSLDLSGLTSAEGLKLPQNIGESLNLSGLTSAEGLELPQNIGGSLDLSGLTSAEGLVLPQNIGGSLNLSGLTSAENLVLPVNIDINAYLNSLKSVKNLVLPKSMEGCLYLKGLTSTEGLIIPDSFNYVIILSDFHITEDTAKEYQVTTVGKQKSGENQSNMKLHRIKDFIKVIFNKKSKENDIEGNKHIK